MLCVLRDLFEREKIIRYYTYIFSNSNKKFVQSNNNKKNEFYKQTQCLIWILGNEWMNKEIKTFYWFKTHRGLFFNLDYQLKFIGKLFRIFIQQQKCDSSISWRLFFFSSSLHIWNKIILNGAENCFHIKFKEYFWQ